jgi:hypothetical protein
VLDEDVFGHIRDHEIVFDNQYLGHLGPSSNSWRGRKQGKPTFVSVAWPGLCGRAGTPLEPRVAHLALRKTPDPKRARRAGARNRATGGLADAQRLARQPLEYSSALRYRFALGLKASETTYEHAEDLPSAPAGVSLRESAGTRTH